MGVGIGEIAQAGSRYRQARTPAHAAATATEVVVVANWDKAVKLINAWFIPDTIVTGQATNYTNLNLLNDGTTAAGTELSNLDYDGTAVVSTAARVRVAWTIATPSTQAAASTTSVQFEKVGTGLAIPAGIVVLEYAYA